MGERGSGASWTDGIDERGNGEIEHPAIQDSDAVLDGESRFRIEKTAKRRQHQIPRGVASTHFDDEMKTSDVCEYGCSFGLHCSQ